MAERIGLFRALWRFFTFYKLRKAIGLARAADRIFTSSADGIAAAFDIHQNEMIRQFNEYRDAVAQVEGVLEDQRQRLANLNKEEEELIKRREGALAFYEEAEKKGDNDAIQKHQAAFERFETRIQEIEGLQVGLEKKIKETSDSMKKHMSGLTKLQAEIQDIPKDKAEAIAEFVSANKIIELNDRLLGLQDSFDSGPIDAVLKHNRELSAKARITEKLAGADVRLQDEEYIKAGRASTAKEKMQQMLAARRAERVEKEGKVSEKKEEEKDDRPRI